MVTRILSGAVVVTLLLVLAFLDAGWWIGAVTLVSLLAVDEAYDMDRASGRRPAGPIGLILAPVLTLLLALGHDAALLAAVIVLGTVAGFVWQMRRDAERRSTTDWLSTLAHPVYLGCLLGFLAGLRGLGAPELGRAWLLLHLMMIWANDSGAYVGGRLVGRRPLSPTISPKKTLEGAIAGSLACLLVALILPEIGGPLAPLSQLPLWPRVGLALGISILAPTGDLSLSVLKRQAGVKDTGRLIPGHGGVLDRLDSLMFTAPLVYLVARWLGA